MFGADFGQMALRRSVLEDTLRSPESDQTHSQHWQSKPPETCLSNHSSAVGTHVEVVDSLSSLQKIAFVATAVLLSLSLFCRNGDVKI